MSILDDLTELLNPTSTSEERGTAENGMLTISDGVMEAYIYKFCLAQSLMNAPAIERDEILREYEL